MKEYVLNYLVADLRLYKKRRYNGRGWSIAFRPADDYLGKPAPVSQNYQDEAGNWQKETAKLVVISAHDYRSAVKVVELIEGAHCVLDGDSLMLHDNLLPYPADPQEAIMDEITLRITKGSGQGRSDTPLACMVAAKASYRKYWVYAILKLMQSYRSSCTPWIDLDPHTATEMLPGARTPEECAVFANAITLAYGAIEELGLELRASSGNPSRPRGTWNPNVRQDLETRLAGAGINLAEPLLWQLRGSKTRLESARPTQRIAKASYSYGQVRDEEVGLCDAIADASWLRSKVSAHRYSKLTEVLSPYDVDNVQHLARRLILESLGVWLVNPRRDGNPV